MSKKLTEWEHRVRFLDGFERSENGCWIWSGALNHAGYALFHSCIDGVMFELGHRYSFVFHKGPIPDGHILRHSCDERRCVNPGHVLSGTAGSGRAYYINTDASKIRAEIRPIRSPTTDGRKESK
jgi:hypothetical protein